MYLMLQYKDRLQYQSSLSALSGETGKPVGDPENSLVVLNGGRWC